MKTWHLFRALLISTALSTGCDSDSAKPAEGKADAAVEPSIQDQGLQPEQLTGTYLFGVSTILARSAPIVLMVELAGEAQDDQISVRLRFRPISKQDRMTAVGEWSDWTAGEVDESGHWNSSTVHVDIPAEANPIIASETVADVVFEGELLDLRSEDDPAAELNFLCGSVTGKVIDPIPVDDLGGSTFAAARIGDLDDLAGYPEVTIDCDHGLPRPLQ